MRRKSRRRKRRRRKRRRRKRRKRRSALQLYVYGIMVRVPDKKV